MNVLKNESSPSLKISGFLLPSRLLLLLSRLQHLKVYLPAISVGSYLAFVFSRDSRLAVFYSRQRAFIARAVSSLCIVGAITGNGKEATNVTCKRCLLLCRLSTQALKSVATRSLVESKLDLGVNEPKVVEVSVNEVPDRGINNIHFKATPAFAGANRASTVPMP